MNQALVQTFREFLRRKLYGSRNEDTFTGRKWLFDRLRAEVTHSKGPVILVTGDPGTGKSAVIARLLETAFPADHTLSITNRDKATTPIIPVIAYHVCSFQDSHTCNPFLFVQNINAMLCLTVKGYESKMRQCTVDAELRAVEQKAGDARAAWFAVLRALAACTKPGDSERYCMVIDSLDESLITHPSQSVDQVCLFHCCFD